MVRGCPIAARVDCGLLPNPGDVPGSAEHATSLAGVLTFCPGTEQTKMLCGDEVIGPTETNNSQLREGWRSKLKFGDKRKAA